MGGEEGCPPYPHHSWLADWISVSPPRVFECRERRHHSHHLLLTTSGEATINWTVDGARKTYHSGIGSVGFFPCDHRRHGMSITSIDGLASTEAGAAKVEQYHRALFAVSCDELRKEIQRLTGRKVREAAVVVEPATGAIVHAFTSGTVVQIFQLEPSGVMTHLSAGIDPDRTDVSS